MLNGHLFETKIFVLFCFPLQASFTVESTAKRKKKKRNKNRCLQSEPMASQVEAFASNTTRHNIDTTANILKTEHIVILMHTPRNTH
jgi:hypothetical protein